MGGERRGENKNYLHNLSIIVSNNRKYSINVYIYIYMYIGDE